MKRKFVLILVLTLCACTVLAHNKFAARHWDFNRPDGPTITVIVDPAGTITVLENGVFIGQRYNSCEVVDG